MAERIRTWVNDHRQDFIRQHNELEDLKHIVSMFMAKGDTILDAIAPRTRVGNSKGNTSPANSKSDGSDDIVDEDSDNDSDNFDDSDDDYSNKDNDHKILLNNDEIPWKISIYPPPGRNIKRLVAWQIERHIQWVDDSDYEDTEELNDYRPNDKAFFYSTFHIRTAKDLKRGKPFKDGNLGIKIARTEAYQGRMGDDHDGVLKSCPWGRPAAALLVGARSHCNNPEDWMLLDEPRRLLIAMEKWYFELDGPKQQSLSRNVQDWTEIKEAEREKWNQAFSVCGCGKGKRCRKSRGESGDTD